MTKIENESLFKTVCIPTVIPSEAEGSICFGFRASYLEFPAKAGIRAFLIISQIKVQILKLWNPSGYSLTAHD
jgi:hypothetical protein